MYILERTTYKKDCTLGVLKDPEGKRLLVTIEEPDRNNEPFVSCIPEGEYEVVPYSSAKYKGVFEVLNVPNRTKILIHIGNTTKDTEGCILVGMEYGLLGGVQAVYRSTEALKVLKKAVKDKPFTLKITSD